MSCQHNDSVFLVPFDKFFKELRVTSRRERQTPNSSSRTRICYGESESVFRATGDEPSPLVGSSRNTTLEDAMNAIPTHSLLFCPPDNVPAVFLDSFLRFSSLIMLLIIVGIFHNGTPFNPERYSAQEAKVEDIPPANMMR